MNHRRILPLAAVAIATAALPAQTWSLRTEAPTLSPRLAAYDAHRDRTVAVFADGQTWEHDGQHWLHTGVSYADPSAAALVYHEQRGRVLAFGQSTSEYDGSRWVVRTTDHTPPPRNHTSLAYDSQRGRVVMFGGLGNGFRDDTWEFDGHDWLRRLPAHKPSPRSDTAMAFDRQRGVTVLFGGRDAQSELGGHFEWNGTDWLERQPAGQPSGRSGAQMAYDDNRQRLVLLGGFRLVNGLPAFDAQPFEFDGASWTQRAIPTAPTPRLMHSMVTVAGGVRVFGGAQAIGDDQRFDVFDYDGVAFTQRGGQHVGYSTVAYDELRQRTVVLGHTPTSLATYEWDGDQLLRIAVAGPSLRSDYSLCSGLGGGVFAFGGSSSTQPLLGDSWRYDGLQWQPVAATGPSPRILAAMTNDTFRNRIVLFGGRGANQIELADTWEFDGTAWTLHAATGPQARYRAAMAAYPGRALVVMHGGNASNPITADTWGFDGTAWTVLDSSLEAGDDEAMAFVPSLSLMMMTRNAFQSGSMTYHYVPFTGWSPLDTAPSQHPGGRLAVDASGEAIEIGGPDGLSVSLRTQYPATVLAYSPGCSNANVPPRMVSHRRPVPGVALDLELVGAEPQQLALVGWTITPSFSYIGGCISLVTPTELLTIGVTDALGYLRTPFTLPLSTALHGIVLGLQSVTAEVAGPLFGALALSDGLWSQIGR